MDRAGLGLPERIRCQLASADVDFAHAGLPIIRFESGRPPSDQSAFPRGEYVAAVPLVEPIDRRFVAQRVRGGLVRLAPVARRVGGVGGGTQGCVERFLLDADPHHVHALCAKTVEGRRSRVECGRYNSGSRLSTLDPRLSSSIVVLRVRADVQTDGGDAALRPAPAGFLADSTIQPVQRFRVCFWKSCLFLRWPWREVS